MIHPSMYLKYLFTFLLLYFYKNCINCQFMEIKIKVFNYIFFYNLHFLYRNNKNILKILGYIFDLGFYNELIVLTL